MTQLNASFTNIEAPLSIDASAIEPSNRFDVIVVGFGGAGAAAALTALENGKRVLVLDSKLGGGATAISGGVFYAGGGTPYQKEAGFDDSVGAMYEYLKMETQGIVNDETLMQFCEQSVFNVTWLEKHGVQFNSTYCPVKTSYPSQSYFLYYSGNEAVPDYAKNAKPAPRGHRTYSKTKGLSGDAFFSPLFKSVERLGAKILTSAEVVRLLVDDDNRVSGVEVLVFEDANDAVKHRKLLALYNKFRLVDPIAKMLMNKIALLEQKRQSRKQFSAKSGVIISSGGFIFNPSMLSHYAPKYEKGLPLGTPGCNGSGIELGQSVGGQIDNMKQISAWRFINPPFSWAKGIIINNQGKRYVNEQVYGAKIGYHMVAENDGRAILVLNRALYKKSIKEALFGGLWSFQVIPALLNLFLNKKSARSIDELAEKIGVNSSELKKTICSYNLAANGLEADQFNKSEEFIENMDEGPYYAMDVSIDSKLFPCPMITLGGLVVNEQTGAVKGQGGEDIPGLYAAGRAAVGIASRFYVSGLSIADCIYSGRRAANALSVKKGE